jgi:hypothetical protein
MCVSIRNKGVLVDMGGLWDRFSAKFQGIQPLVYPSTCPEDLPRSLPFNEFVEKTARQKAQDVLGRIKNEKVIKIWKVLFYRP